MMTILPSTYFGPISYFSLLLKAEESIINTHERFQKQTVRNRCEILGANGPIKMTVPLRKWSTKIPINAIQIDNSGNWKHVHWMSLISAYRNAPFFEHYEEKIKPVYFSDYSNLIDLNSATLQLILELLKEEKDFSSTFNRDDKYRQDIDDLSLLFVKKRPNQNLPKYQQVFSDRFAFVPDLSILDLVFNLGPRASNYLQNLNVNR